MYANKIDNLDVMGNFLERYRLLKLTQIKSKDLNRSITINFISYKKKFSQNLWQSFQICLEKREEGKIPKLENKKDQNLKVTESQWIYKW